MFEGAPEPDDRDHVLAFKTARDVNAMASGTGGDATAANQATQITAEQAALVLQGSVIETAPATDTASSGLNGRLQRIAQRLTTLITNLGTLAFGAGAAAAALRVELPTDGTGVVGISQVAPGTTNGVMVNTIALATQTLNSAASGAAVDVSRVSVVSVQITAYSGDGLQRGQISNDQTAWTTINFYRPSDGLISQNIAATQQLVFNASGARYFRLLQVSWTSGSTTALISGSVAGAPDGQIVNARGLMTPINYQTGPGSAWIAADGTQVSAGMIPYFWNGTTNERVNGNTDNILLASAARTTTQTSADLTNHNNRGVHVILDMTVVTAGPSVTVTIQAKDANGIYYDLLVGAAVTTISTNVYKIYPGIAVVANGSASDVLPRTFRVKVTANNANAGTYSVAYALVL